MSAEYALFFARGRLKEDQIDKKMRRHDVLFQYLHRASPAAYRGKTARETMTRVIAIADVNALYFSYKKCRSEETWMQKILRTEKRFKTKESLISKFRAACIHEVTTNADFWCDLYLAGLWAEHTGVCLRIVNAEKKTEIVEGPEHEQCLTLLQPSSSSCQFVKSRGKLPPPVSASNEERKIRQCVRASRYTRGVDGATGKIMREAVIQKKEVTQKVTQKIVTQEKDAKPVTQKVTQEKDAKAVTQTNYVVNPATGRKIKVGSKTYQALRDAGMINQGARVNELVKRTHY